VATSQKKVYETSFKLSAVMSKDYQETFEMAQRLAGSLGESFLDANREAERAQEVQTNAFEAAAAAAAAAGLTELLGDLKDAFVEVTRASMDFQYQMSAVEAISQATEGEMQLLSAQARELGETTVFTATQSAEAMTFMAQAGWDTQEMLAGMPGVISLAAASGTDLAEASSIVADTLAGFGMSADETMRLVDVLAQTAAHSNTNVSLMGDTFKNAAAIAGALGFSIEDTSVMLGLMANAGVKGSRAGTTLRNIFNGLAKGLTLSAEAFGEVEYSMFKSDGSAKTLGETVDELRGYFSQMTTEEKYLNAEELAGLRGYNGLLAILNATDEQYAELYADIENCTGAAERMAKVRLDNLQGDVTLLKSAWESLKISFGDELTPNNRGVVQFLTEIVQGFNNLIEMEPGIVHVIGAIGAAGGAAAGVLSLVTALAALKKTLSVLGIAFSGPVGWITLAAAALGGLTYAVYTHIQSQESELKEVQELISAHRELIGEYENAVAAAEEEYGGTEALVEQYIRLAEKENRSAAEKAKLLAITKKLNELMPELELQYDYYTDKVNGSAEAVRNLAKAQYMQNLMAKDQELILSLTTQSYEYSDKATSLRYDIAGLEEQENLLKDQLVESADDTTYRGIWEGMKIGKQLADVQGELKDKRAALHALQLDWAVTQQELNVASEEYAKKADAYNSAWNTFQETTAAETEPADLVYQTPEEINTVNVDINNVYNVASEEAAQTVREANEEIVDVLRGIYD